MVLANVAGHSVDFCGLGIASHQGHAGNCLVAGCYQAVENIAGQQLTFVCPQKRRMTARTSTRTPGEVDGQAYLIGYLLKYNIMV